MAKLVGGFGEAAVDRALEQDRVVAPALVAFLRRGIIGVDAALAGRIDDRLPAGHHPDLLIGDELDALLPAVPEGAELTVLLVLDQELHDQAELVGREVAGLGNLGVLGVLEINGGKDRAVDPGVLHRRLAL